MFFFVVAIFFFNKNTSKTVCSFVLQIQNDIVDILMAFTQPSLAKEESEEGRLSMQLILSDNSSEEIYTCVFSFHSGTLCFPSVL